MNICIPDTIYLAVCKNKSVYFSSLSQSLDCQETKSIGYDVRIFDNEKAAQSFVARNVDYTAIKQKNLFSSLNRINGYYYQNNKNWVLQTSPHVIDNSEKDFVFIKVNKNFYLTPKNSPNWIAAQKKISKSNTDPVKLTDIKVGGEYSSLTGGTRIVLGKVNSIKTYERSSVNLTDAFLILKVNKYSPDIINDPFKYIKKSNDIARYISIVQSPTFRVLEKTHNIHKNMIDIVKDATNAKILSEIKTAWKPEWTIHRYSDLLNMVSSPNKPDAKNLQSNTLLMFL